MGLAYVRPETDRLVRHRDHRIVTDLGKLSETSGKRHDNVLRAAKELLAGDPTLEGRHLFPVRAGGRLIGADVTAAGVLLISGLFENEPRRGFVVKDWVRDMLGHFREAEAARCLWWVILKNRQGIGIGADGKPVVIGNGAIIRDEWVRRWERFGDDIAELARKNNLLRPVPAQADLFSAPGSDDDDWDVMMRKLWGDGGC
jgi:hypothetical protein